jgi:intracellular multiplication protein IcmD
MDIKLNANKIFVLASGLFLLAVCGDALAGGTSNLSLGNMASSITKTFESVAKLITAGSYIAGLGFALGAVMKFKQHKDNPTQIPIGTPIALTFIAAALLFLPTILGIAGMTMFGVKGTVGGPTGYIFS